MSERSLRVGSFWITVAACALSWSSSAHAEAGNVAAAQGLFDEGKALMAGGALAEACPKFEESERLDPASGTLVNLARCYEQMGRIASAWSTYLEAAASAKTSGNSERETAARAEAARLAARVSRWVIEVPPGSQAPSLAITRDGTPVGAPQWGVAVPTDPGEHVLAATAPGRVTFRTTITVKGEGSTTRTSIPALAMGPAHAGQTEPTKPGGEHPSSGLGAQRILALTAGGIGIAGGVIGGVFGAKAMSKKTEADKYCAGTTCTDPRGVTAGNDAHSAGNIATIGMVVGIVGLAGGVVLWVTAPSAGRTTEVQAGLGNVSVRGSW